MISKSLRNKIGPLVGVAITLGLIFNYKTKLTVSIANQIDKTTQQKESFKNKVDQYASFAGGIDSLEHIIQQRLEKVDLSKSFSAGDTAFVELTIEADGRVTGLGHLSPELSTEAQQIENYYIAYLLELPYWNPSIRDGKPVRSWVVLPIVFS